MPNVYALTAHPLAQSALQLAQEEHKTKGFRAVFGVALMFLMLCGGVWLLLQSSFGPKQAYLVTGVAFFGSWFVLSLLWFTGVPGVPLIDIPRSTPRFNGPQGAGTDWQVAAPHGEEKLARELEEFEQKAGAESFIAVDESVTAASGDKAGAEAAATERISEEYAIELGIGAGDITVPNVVQVTETRLARKDGRYKYAQVTYGPADTTDADNEPTKELKAKIKPKTISLVLDTGSLAQPTYQALVLFGLLLAAHIGMLVKYELNRVPQPQGVPERVPAGV